MILSSGIVASAGAQEDWRPPGTGMPDMPAMSELSGSDWLAPRAQWFRGISGVDAGALVAVGEPRGSAVVQLVRFRNGPMPAVVWSDRNADGRADLIELFRRGSVVIQLIDADYDGNANVLRIYDASGALIREERM
jgi:hypothetical protein